MFGGSIRTLLRCHLDCELEIPFCPPYCFFNRDFSVFNCGGLALGEDKLNFGWEAQVQIWPDRQPDRDQTRGIGALFFDGTALG
jgi:hypothetical protein